MISINFLILFFSIISSVAVIVVIMVFFLQKKDSYNKDRYRLEIEDKIYKLYNDMIISQSRFKDANHLIMDWNDNQSKNIDSNDFFEALGIKKDLIEVDKNKVFVLTPFHPRYYSQYEVIKSTIEELGLQCTKGDDSTKNENILSHIVVEICKSNLIIANISGKNPNVFYELGIAQALGKRTIVVAEAESEIPFNLSNNRLLMFINGKQLREKLKKWLVNSFI